MEMSKWIVSRGHAPHRAECSVVSHTASRRQQSGRWKPPIQMTGAALLIALAAPPAQARDRGQWANSSPDIKAWFDGLRSGKGPCCSDADGSAVSDVDWESKGGHYRVRIEGEWFDVPDDAVITEPNRVGRAMVWPMRGYQGLSIRCFMPGSMT
ncbi:conserved hypothetical protein [Bradyrhizobium sp. ORS 278]|nr:hypothetical protein [Bradyrhizobium sp. ORS 278]CAL78055.1 conserved hypothetical protein [Bradyrhizobium sp. ORS 278]